MPDFTITYSVPQEKAPDFLDAMRKRFKMANATPKQIEDQIARDFKTRLRIDYINHMQSKSYDIEL